MTLTKPTTTRPKRTTRYERDLALAQSPTATGAELAAMWQYWRHQQAQKGKRDEVLYNVAKNPNVLPNADMLHYPEARLAIMENPTLSLWHLENPSFWVDMPMYATHHYMIDNRVPLWLREHIASNMQFVYHDPNVPCFLVADRVSKIFQWRIDPPVQWVICHFHDSFPDTFDAFLDAPQYKEEAEAHTPASRKLLIDAIRKSAESCNP